MNIDYNLISFIDLLALTQGLITGAILIISNRKSRPSFLLGLFLITYSLELINSILADTGILKQMPNLLLLPFNFYFLSVPLFYLYAKSLTQVVSFKKDFSTFLLGILEFLIFLSLFLFLSFTNQTKNFEGIDLALIYALYEYGGLIYSIYFAIKTIRLIRQHQSRVLNYFSNVEMRQLKWVKAIAFFILFFYSLWLFSWNLTAFFHLESYHFTLSAINVGFIYWTGFFGLRQVKVEMTFDKNNEENRELKNSTPNTEVQLKNQKYKQLILLIQKNEYFKIPNLTLSSLAEKVQLSKRELSILINQESGTNFNQFINQFRIDQAKKILGNSDFNHLNMLGIAAEVGFSSKATFFAVFKKAEGISPGIYKKTSSNESNIR